MKLTLHLKRIARRVSGFTLIESSMSILIVGLMLVAALNAVGASKIAQYRNAEQALGPMLAEELMAEITALPYSDPDNSPVFGRENESATVRTSWDDVDDYDGWSATPPQNRDGTDVDGAADWTRSVDVNWVSTSTLNVSGSSTGLKQIVVTVVHDGKPVAVLTSLRSRAWPE